MLFSWKNASITAMLMLATSIAGAAEFKAGEVIVKYKDGVARSRVTMNAMFNAAGVKSVRRYSGTMKGIEHLILNDDIKIEDAIAELQRNDSVEFAHPNYILSLPTRVVNSPNPTQTDPPGGFPCIPGFEIPGCTGDGSGGGDGGGLPGLPGGGEGGDVPCLFPGIPFPPGCTDSGGGGGGGGGTTPPAPGRPALLDAPADVVPPVVDPDLAKAYGLGKIGAPDAWATFTGSKTFIVADIDTGVDYNHEDLAFNVWRNPTPGPKNDIVGYDFIHDDGLPYDDQGHGTHTGGTIAATGGNGKGISGVIQRVSLMSIKFLSAQGSGDTAGAIRSIDYAIEHGAKVLSNSWGGKGDEDNKGLYASIERARLKDVLFIAAAGNDGANNDNPSSASYPAAFDNDNLIAVAATDNKDGLAYFSNTGVKTVHLGAPGTNIYSTVPKNKYKAESGTSMACPHVAGAAALIWAAHPSWDYKKVKQVLLDTADKIPSLAGKTITGGRLNVLKALRSTD